MDKARFCRELDGCKTSMYRLALGILKNPDDAEDAVAQAVLRGYEAREALRKAGSFKSWITKITANECYAILRIRARYSSIEELETEPASEPREDAELWDVVMSMPEAMRGVTILYYYDGYSIREIAAMLSLTEGAVKTRLSRGRTLLRDALVKEGSI